MRLLGILIGVAILALSVNVAKSSGLVAGLVVYVLFDRGDSRSDELHALTEEQFRATFIKNNRTAQGFIKSLLNTHTSELDRLTERINHYKERIEKFSLLLEKIL